MDTDFTCGIFSIVANIGMHYSPLWVNHTNLTLSVTNGASKMATDQYKAIGKGQQETVNNMYTTC